MREHLSNEILILCEKCNQLSNFHDQELRKKLAIEYNAPLDSTRYTKDSYKEYVKCHAKMLTETIVSPEHRKELLGSLAEYFGCDREEVTLDMITKATAIDTRCA